MECGIPGVVIREDGSVDRSVFNKSFPFVQASEQELCRGVASKDVVIDPALGIWVRIFLPSAQLERKGKLPLLLYFHGSGFVLLSAGSKAFHEHCSIISSALNVMVVSVEYRLAPEFRLPSAFDDACTALAWLQSQARVAAAAAASEQDRSSQAEPWLREHADFTSCIFIGGSAGGTIVNHLAARSPSVVDNQTLRVRGIISIAPGFGGSQASASEIKFAKRDALLTYECLLSIWKLALPENASPDHPYVDPRGVDVSCFPPVLLIVGAEDLLVDRQLQFQEFLQERGVRVTLLVCEGHSHSDMGLGDAEHEAYSVMRQFMTTIL